MDMQTFLNRLPKVELHCHLEGTVKPATYTELHRKNGLPLPAYEDPAELYRFEPTVKEALALYSRMSQSMRSREDMARVIQETLTDAANDGVRYTEMFWSPQEHLDTGMTYAEQVAGLVDGIRAAETASGIQCRLISAINRERPPEEGVELVQMVIDHPNDYVIGVSLDYDELNHPPEEFWKAFRMAKQAGLHRTAHACEWCRPPRDVETCLDLLECERIDHGYRVLLDPAITKRCADDGIVFTVIPLTAVFGLFNPEDWVAKGFDPSRPAIRAMVEHGLRVMLNSDDPGLTQMGRTQNYAVAQQAIGFTPAELKQSVLNGIDGSWLDDSTKRQWRTAWAAEMDELISQMEAVR